jgi:hypothetical protein
MGITADKQQNTSMLWLSAILADEVRRAMLRALIDQYELPVIQMGSRKSQQLRKGRTTPRDLRHVNSAAT